MFAAKMILLGRPNVFLNLRCLVQFVYFIFLDFISIQILFKEGSGGGRISAPSKFRLAAPIGWYLC